MNNLLLTILDEATSGDSTSSSSATSSMKALFTKPSTYIVIGAIILLILLFYFIKRFVKAPANTAVIIERKGQFYKLLDANNPKAFLVPFSDRVVASVPLNEIELNSDKLFINNGPDALYKITYNLKYKVIDAKAAYKTLNNFESYAIDKINDTLREFSDAKGADIILKAFVENKNEIINVLNKAFEDNSIEVTFMKIKAIEPLGKSSKN